MRAGRCLGEKRVELEVESRDSGDLWQGVSKEFLRLVRLSGIRDVEKVYRADDCVFAQMMALLMTILSI